MRAPRSGRMRNALFAVALGLSVVLAGCTGSAVTLEQAKAAPARLEADMGPDGQMSSASSTMQMSMAMEMGDASMSMDMTMEFEQEFHQGGAASATVRFSRFHMVADRGSDMPDLSSVVMHVFCAPDRWVLSTEGMTAAGMQDVSVETANTRGTCVGKSSSSGADMGRLMGEMAPEMDAVSSSVMGAFQIPEFTFVSLEGDTATYRAPSAQAGMPPMNVTATFDGDGRIAHSTMTMSMPAFGMEMETVSEYDYGTRSAAPNTHGERKL